jgi:hypothetical protein
LPFLPASTVSSAAGVVPRGTSASGISRVCCAPQPAMGFAMFPCARSATRRSLRHPSSMAPHPSKRFPPRQATDRHRGFPRSPIARALSPFRRPQGFAPPGSPSWRLAVAGQRHPMLPWASVPTRAPFPTVRAETRASWSSRLRDPVNGTRCVRVGVHVKERFRRTAPR